MGVLDYSIERDTGCLVAGVDEVGRGVLAGPVVAAAVILDPGAIPHGLNDSKQLSKSRRESLYAALVEQSRWAVAEATVEEVDHHNIYHASLLAMRRAVEALKDPCPAFVLIDGNATPPGLPCLSRTIVKGDTICLSIAAASIIAKVTRDRMMEQLALAHPYYGWERNAGYGTAEHLKAIAEHGITSHHRRSFAPVREALVKQRESAYATA